MVVRKTVTMHHYVENALPTEPPSLLVSLSPDQIFCIIAINNTKMSTLPLTGSTQHREIGPTNSQTLYNTLTPRPTRIMKRVQSEFDYVTT